MREIYCTCICLSSGRENSLLSFVFLGKLWSCWPHWASTYSLFTALSFQCTSFQGNMHFRDCSFALQIGYSCLWRERNKIQWPHFELFFPGIMFYRYLSYIYKVPHINLYRNFVGYLFLTKTTWNACFKIFSTISTKIHNVMVFCIKVSVSFLNPLLWDSFNHFYKTENIQTYSLCWTWFPWNAAPLMPA